MGILDESAALDGRIAAIVGGGGGIGRAVALALARSGVDVALCDIDEAAMEATRRDIAALGRRVLAIRADVREADDLAAFHAAVGEAFERLDILVNVAGGVTRRAFADSSEAQCATDIRLNFGYVVDSVRYALPMMMRSGRGGSIINFTTIEAHRGAAGYAVYAGAKAATTNFTRALAVELGASRIRVNALASDTTPSRGNMTALGAEMAGRLNGLPPEWSASAMAMYVPLRELPSPDAIANGALFLASDLSRSITGTTLHIDGGTWAAGGFLDWPFGDGPSPAPLAGTLEKLHG
jgi:NAD(P)-dependent dehydrogenase (short-subunit alcohol dehydrogenase family)